MDDRQQRKAGWQPLMMEPLSSKDSECSGSSSQATWLQDRQKLGLHREDCPEALVKSQHSLPCVSRKDSIDSAISAFSAEHLAAAWVATTCKGRAEALTEQLQLSEEPLRPANEAPCVLQQLHDEANHPGAGWRQSCYPEHAQSASPLGGPADPQTLQEVTHTAAVSAGSYARHTAVRPLQCSGPLDCCNEVTAGIDPGHRSPVHGWLQCLSEAGGAACELSFSGSLSHLSDSDNDDELARLEAKYGICNT